MRRSTRLLLGRFRPEDPALLVWYEGDDTVYRLDLPTLEVLADPHVCLVVGEAPGELGLDKKAIQRRLKRHLQHDSIVLGLPNWGSSR